MQLKSSAHKCCPEGLFQGIMQQLLPATAACQQMVPAFILPSDFEATSDCKTYTRKCQPHLMTCCYCCDLVCAQRLHGHLQASTLFAVLLLCSESLLQVLCGCMPLKAEFECRPFAQIAFSKVFSKTHTVMLAAASFFPPVS